MMQFEVSFSTRTATAQEVRLHGQPLHSQYLVVVKLLYLWKKKKSKLPCIENTLGECRTL